MADSTLIALAGIGATAASPLLSQWLLRSRDKAQYTHDVAKIDRAELRELVDAIAQNVARAVELYRDVRSKVLQQGVRFDDTARQTAEQFRLLGLQVDVDTARLAIRLGREHRLCQAHNDVAQAITDVVQHVWIAVSMGDHADLPETWDIIQGEGDKLYEARDRFIDAAVSLVGSHLIERPV